LFEFSSSLKAYESQSSLVLKPIQFLFAFPNAEEGNVLPPPPLPSIYIHLMSVMVPPLLSMLTEE